MKNHRMMLASMAIVAMMLAVAGSAAAASRTIDGGDTFEKTYKAESDDFFAVLTWWSDDDLYFTVEDPDGTIVQWSSGLGDSFAFDPFTSDAGDYVFTWRNNGTTAVDLEYTVMGFGEIEEAWGTFILILVIGVIVVIAIVVLLVVLLLMKGKKKAPQQLAAPLGPPVIEGKCAKCGSPVDPGVAFCAKCGAPLR
ncbi:MAG: zinc ribbon domain-containing protein [Thermoplasmata archaeon]|jgi:hypothetical protein|nr:zinc ribbon domain-containing protein [Thermoplasmata archaeon]